MLLTALWILSYAFMVLGVIGIGIICICAPNAYRRENGYDCWFCGEPWPCGCGREHRIEQARQERDLYMRLKAKYDISAIGE